MFLLKCKTNFAFGTTRRLYSLCRKSHYEVLKLRRNCTDKEIKEAFVKMSKEYHPDMNKNEKAQEKFVRIVEAYNVLSKPRKRAQYDNMSYVQPHTYSQPYVYKAHRPYMRTNYYDFGHAQSKSEDSAKGQRPFHDTPLGIHKIPNMYLVMACIGIAIVGFVLQAVVIREMYTIQRRQALEKSKRLAEELEKVHLAAKSKDNLTHTQQLLEKIVSASNPSVATASLGQALANNKKDMLLSDYELAEISPKDDLNKDQNYPSFYL